MAFKHSNRLRRLAACVAFLACSQSHAFGSVASTEGKDSKKPVYKKRVQEAEDPHAKEEAPPKRWTPASARKNTEPQQAAAPAAGCAGTSVAAKDETAAKNAEESKNAAAEEVPKDDVHVLRTILKNGIPQLMTVEVKNGTKPRKVPVESTKKGAS